MDLEKVSYDLRAAIENNSVPVPEDFEVLAEILSDHHDEGEYFWLIRDRASGKLQVINGSHDYTGWDCQSGANITEPFDSLDQLHLFIAEHDNQMRPVRQLMLEQARGAGKPR